jgi:DNA-binding NarL/FixJ family response regulator
MEHTRCAVLSEDKSVSNLLSDVLLKAGYDRAWCSQELGVAKLGSYSPRVLMVDFDHLVNDKLETIRQLRFVLPECSIAVVSSDLNRSWARQCHMAGANGVLSGSGDASRMLAGLLRAVRTGCYTDPRFVALN